MSMQWLVVVVAICTGYMHCNGYVCFFNFESFVLAEWGQLLNGEYLHGRSQIRAFHHVCL